MSPQPRPITLSAAALALLCAALWGGTTVAIRFTQDAWPPLSSAGLRFAIGTMFLALWCRLDGQTLKLRRHDLWPVVTVSVMLFIQIGTFHWGMDHTSSAHGAVMIGSNPLWVAVLAHLLLTGDRLTLGKAGGLLLASAGVAAAVTFRPAPTGDADPARLLGTAVVLTSSWLLATKTVYTKHALRGIEPGKLIFWSNLLGSAMLLTAGLLWEGVERFTYSPAAVWGLLYQGVVVAGFCFAMWTTLLRRHRASQLTVFGFAQPLFGMLFGFLLRGDVVNPPLVLGGAAVALGIVIVTREGAVSRRA